MRKIATFAVLLTFVFTAVAPSFGQRIDEVKGERRLVPGNFDSVRAITEGSGVLVRWTMRFEKDVAIYNVYRIGNGTKQIISPLAVPGSAGRFGETIVYGEKYDFFDLDGDVGSQYAIEGVARDGRRFSSREVSAIAVKSIENEIGISAEAFRNTRAAGNSDLQRSDITLTGELQDIVSLHAQEPNPIAQRSVAAQSGAKIGVKRDGFYRVSSAELAAANFAVNSDSAKWRLFLNGNEQAITVGPAGSFIEFYGRGIDTPETDTRYYYLVADTIAGKRIGTKIVRQIPGAATAERYAVRAGKKERNFYSSQLFNYEEENYLGRYIADVPERINFNLTGVDQATNFRFKVTLYGFSNNHHRFTLKVNGNPLPDIVQFGTVYMWTDVTIPGTFLNEGSNQVELASLSPSDAALFDRIDVSYDRKYLADQGKISFTMPGSRRANIAGFSTSAVRTYDMSFEGNPVRLLNLPVVEEPTGFTVKLPSTRPIVGYAFEDSGLLQVSSIVENLPSTLSATTTSADMVIISHSAASVLNEANAWKAYRESEAGGRIVTKVVDIADVYDEFSYGVVGNSAIKSFLEYAHTEWATGPKYVLLIGDATHDPRNYEGYGFFNLVPSKPVRFIQEEGFSDDALVDFDDDGGVEIPIGRIPVRNAGQVTSALNKMKYYEQNQLNFARGSLFPYDSALDYDFEGMSQALANELPLDAPRSFIVAGTPTSNSNLISSLNEGKTFVNYAGHGAAGLWSGTNFFSVAEVPSLTNAINPSFFSMLTCLNGFFLRTNADSIAESLVFRPSGGAAAAWASTSATTPDVQFLMGQRFIRKMSEPPPGNIERVGDLIKDAKTVIDHGPDVRLSWVLIGDPAMKMP